MHFHVSAEQVKGDAKRTWFCFCYRLQNCSYDLHEQTCKSFYSIRDKCGTFIIIHSRARLAAPSTIVIAPFLYTAAQSPLKEYYTKDVNTIERSRTTAQQATEASQFLGVSDNIS